MNFGSFKLTMRDFSKKLKPSEFDILITKQENGSQEYR